MSLSVISAVNLAKTACSITVLLQAPFFHKYFVFLQILGEASVTAQ
jgi:hypothetical protein